jgi:hypothetical protein
LSIGNCCRTDPDDRLHSDRPGQFFFPTLALLCAEFVDQIKTTVCRIFSCQRTPDDATAIGKTPRSLAHACRVMNTSEPSVRLRQTLTAFAASAGQPSRPARLARQP